MFNRTIEVGLVKKSKKNREDAMEEAGYSAEEITERVDQTANTLCFLTITVVGSYMLFDTVRKIAVNRLSK